ncbi:hypothetical protein IAG25_35085 [Caballeronia sp. EK]|uniref:hypothetical protein n=1 Tax=Caballeronia sp. EK TaxID=2767469 RepID=UPI001655EDD7|nr:hypothetical protein [Caballeronia sp. EK]MBC8642035.1 hypothetical protein [Caballeronia sp. EK]
MLGHISFVLPGHSGQKAREVKRGLRSQRIMLPGRGRLTLTCVEACEVDAPADVTPVIWGLVTNRKLGAADALFEIVDWYRARWEIEMFFKEGEYETKGCKRCEVDFSTLFGRASKKLHCSGLAILDTSKGRL